MQKHTYRLQRFFHDSLSRIVATDEGQLRRVPNHVLALVLFVCASVLLQGIADVVLKILSYGALLPKLEWRTDFLFLTAVSVLMGYRTFQGMRQRKFDVTRNSIELGLVVELGLIIGDSHYLSNNVSTYPWLIGMRVPFIVLTSLNMVILVYTYHTLKLRRWWR